MDNGAPLISHMLFVDDSYLYCKATLDETSKVCRLLHTFEAASGRRVNRQKSSIFSVKIQVRTLGQRCVI